LAPTGASVIAVDSTWVYWVENMGLVKVAK
jgi:hypothetical protein